MLKTSFAPLIFLFLLFSCKTESFKNAEITAERIPIDKNIRADAEIEAFIKPYAEQINKTLDSVVAYNPTDLNKSDGELNTAIGNLMAEIVMEQANPVFKSRTGKEIDMVLLNHGGIRSTVGKGPVTARTAYSLMPFENEIVVAELKGNKILEMLTYLENNRTAHPLSGIKIKVNKNYKVISATINGNEIDPNHTYNVATSDYLQQGGDNMTFFKDPVNLYRVDYKIRNAIIDYFNRVDTLRTARDERYIKID
ncbi:hypothetical protein FK178_00995 [Antarcticibacterium arcticum]|uniref:5'-Nucleotidase C-terminal domain-containing protein n=1 Tax=Antarcticibacterium arcticum TaxID=2585771 RepID=A0A5B8YIE6_9FLAO|nr:5'-nucleotidase [Antarcticibacterium arcticum]QED36383.1 hypothetical protein FK178_00995 [Antarcticibacterium arcticum]